MTHFRTPRLPVLLLSGLLLVACSQQQTTPAPTLTAPPAAEQPAAPRLSRSLGRVEVTFSGVGSTFYATSVRDLTAGLTGQALTRAAAGLQLRFNSKGSFDVGAPGTGTRYLHATYDVRNASSDGITPSTTARSNLMFIAVDAATPATIVGSAVRNLKRFDGSDADPSLATGITPLHGMISTGGTPAVNASLADFMAFTETEASSLGNVPEVRSVLPYGFVVRSKTSTANRTLAANPAAGQFDGQVTFAVKLPLQADPKNDPYSFSLVFEVVEDSLTRVTKTAEESVASAASRASALGATPVNADTVCQVRVAGSAAAPTSVLTGLGAGSAGSIDTCFGTNGKVITPVGSGLMGDVAVQADGKLVAMGQGNSVTSTTGSDFTLVRYNANGSLDMSFGTGGKVFTPVGPGTSLDLGSALVIQSDGKLVAAGHTTNAVGTTSTDFALARYNVNGTLDSTFGTGGKITTPVGGTDSDDRAFSLVAQTDGKLVAAGYASLGIATGDDFGLVRYNADGTLDTTFGTGGKAITPVGGTNSSDQASALVLQPDGKLVAAGYTSNRGGSTGRDAALVRYNADGSLDMSFGTGGKVITAVGTTNSTDSISELVLQPDGKLVAGVYTGNVDGTTGPDFALVRYNADGTLDTTFGRGGKVITSIGTTNSLDQLTNLMRQSDGKLVAAGTTDSGSGTGYDFALMRFNENGTLDTSFGTGGKVVTPVGSTSSQDSTGALALQPDGRIIVAGHTINVGGTTGSDFALVRYWP